MTSFTRNDIKFGFELETLIYDNGGFFVTSCEKREARYIIDFNNERDASQTPCSHTSDCSVDVTDLSMYTRYYIPFDNVFGKIMGKIMGQNVGDKITQRKIIKEIEIISLPIIIDSKYNYYKTIESVYKTTSCNGYYKLLNNETTSNHIHFSCMSNDNNAFSTPEHLLNIGMVWWLFEPIIHKLVAPWRINNEYCEPLDYCIFSSQKEDTVHSTFYQARDLDSENWDMLQIAVKNEEKLVKNKLLTRIFNHINDSLGKVFVNDYTYDNIRTTFKNTFLVQYFSNRGKNTELKSIMLGPVDDKSSINDIIKLFLKDRYCAINFLNLVKKNKSEHTIEIRLKHGSADPNEMCAYVDLFSLFLIAIVSNYDKKLEIITKNFREIIENTEKSLNIFFEFLKPDNDLDLEVHTRVCIYFRDFYNKNKEFSRLYKANKANKANKSNKSKVNNLPNILIDYSTKKGGGNFINKRYIRFDAKRYVVRHEKNTNTKYIMKNKCKVYLKEIRGRYRYV
jgi:hypothetical protein